MVKTENIGTKAVWMRCKNPAQNPGSIPKANVRFKSVTRNVKIMPGERDNINKLLRLSAAEDVVNQRQ